MSQNQRYRSQSDADQSPVNRVIASDKRKKRRSVRLRCEFFCCCCCCCCWCTELLFFSLPLSLHVVVNKTYCLLICVD
jgi:hypothetical protein